MRHIPIEFSEDDPVTKELTEAEAAAEAAAYGIRVSEEAAPGYVEIRAQVAASYQKMGLSESEAKLAADLDLGRRL
jgi:hypothetical protein